MNYGQHVPLPQFQNNRPVKNAHFIKIRGGTESFAERYTQTVKHDIAPLLQRTRIQKRDGIKAGSSAILPHIKL